MIRTKNVTQSLPVNYYTSTNEKNDKDFNEKYKQA